MAITKGRNGEDDRGNNVNFNTRSHPETASLDPYETGEYLYTYWGTEPSDVSHIKQAQIHTDELSKTVLVKLFVVQVMKEFLSVHILHIIWLKHL